MKSVQTQSPLAGNKELRLNARVLYFCYTGLLSAAAIKCCVPQKNIMAECYPA